MIISKTPFRISFAGGVSDIRDYYCHSYGSVVSTTINKFIYVTVNSKFDNKIRVSYSKTEIVPKVNKIRHPIVREGLKLTKLDGGLEITTIADIPSGTGLGSSSAFTVGLLNALHAFRGEHKGAEVLADEACKIEIDILKEPIGKQDQYACAYGGLNQIRFNPDESVFVNPVISQRETKKELDANLLLFYTGIHRRASTILTESKQNMGNLKVAAAVEMPGANYGVVRSSGIKEAMKEYGIRGDIEIVDATLDMTTAESRITSYLIANPDVDCIFGLGGIATDRMTSALRNAKKKPGQVLAGGFDAAPGTLTGLETNYMVASIDQQQYLQGYFSVYVLYLMKKYGFAPQIDTGGYLITKENIELIKTLSPKNIR